MLKVDKDKLEIAMKKAGIPSIRQLSIVSGISRQTIYSVQDGGFVSTKVDALADTLGVSPLDLLSADESA